MNGIEYERRVAGFLRRKHFRNIRLTKASGDYGVDILASKGRHRYAVQCKYYNHPVGVSAVQQVVAGMAFYECDRALVVTNNRFTRQACEHASRNEVELLPHISGKNNIRAVFLRIILYLLLADILFTPYRIIALIALHVCISFRLLSLYLRYKIRKERKVQKENEDPETDI